MARAYYNEIDKQAAQWLRNLIARGLIAPGDVDERSISDVSPDDLRGYTQCHFFAGIGVWSYALRRAGWDDSRPVWTGSCPCQPFSSAGAQEGFADERHLWPDFHWLIQQCRPPVLFGEQVAGKAVEPWVDLVQADLEALGYAFGGVPFPSAGVGAPHIRDRLFWVADSDSVGFAGLTGVSQGRRAEAGTDSSCSVRLLGNAFSSRLEERIRLHGVPGAEAGAESGEASERAGIHVGGLADANGKYSRRDAGSGASTEGEGQLRKLGDMPATPSATDRPGAVNGIWRDADWLSCRDGKWRPVESGTFPLAHGAASRVVRLRAYGNAINAEAATQFIGAFLDIERGVGRADLIELDPLI